MDVLNPLLAVVAAIGFSMVFKVRKSHIWLVGVLAFCGYFVRNAMLSSGIGIELSTLFGSLFIGALTDIISKTQKTPLQMLKVPAGIPMIPGAFVYESIKSLLAFVSATTVDAAKLATFVYFGSKSIFILGALAFGLTATSMMYKRR